MKTPIQMNKTKLIAEYKLILQKKSKLSRKQRDEVERRIANLHKKKLVTVDELALKPEEIIKS